MDKKSFGFACLTGAALFAYFVNQRGYFDVPQDKIDEVPEKKAEKIRLNYDKMLKHNIDSLIDTGSPVREAVKDAHTITWEEASAMMPKQCKDYSNEDWVTLDEAQEQVDESRTVIPGRAPTFVYHKGYPEQLAKQIKQREEYLQKPNNSNSGQKVPFRVSQNDGR